MFLLCVTQQKREVKMTGIIFYSPHSPHITTSPCCRETTIWTDKWPNVLFLKWLLIYMRFVVRSFPWYLLHCLLFSFKTLLPWWPLCVRSFLNCSFGCDILIYCCKYRQLLETAFQQLKFRLWFGIPIDTNFATWVCSSPIVLNISINAKAQTLHISQNFQTKCSVCHR